MPKSRIRNVRLTGSDNRSYRERCAYHATIHHAGKGEREADVGRHVTAWAERVACAILGRQFEQDGRNIIAWEELNAYGHYTRKYKETDGLFKLAEGMLSVEVKASMSRASVRKGRQQINDNLNLLRQIRGHFSGLLILFDCSQINPDLVAPGPGFLESLRESGEYGLLQGTDWRLDARGFDKWLWLLDAPQVEQLMAVYGPPAQSECVPDLIAEY